ncbi:universal stress protein [Alloacidobacterium dinghuense]|uniref:Universal stress protein n=1 Tax=Alloacidobacterium dinghuense TaxID=2763107 RepID=A0A7G8BFL3_9BACT|nr:universal stress protein [Alloacidobacterium dinghuense]QNI31333.1 universal stress protein [Alloacidobacterium dinghuense]
MKKIQKIVFPIDFTRRSTKGAQHVATWARKFDAEVVAVHFIDPEDHDASAPPDNLRFMADLPILTEKATRDLDFFCEQNLASCRVRRIVKMGEKAVAVPLLAQDEKADLVMIPRDHQPWVERFMTDSFTAKMLNECPVPIWTSEHLDDDPSPNIMHILCAVHVEDSVSLDAANERLIQAVRTVASTFGARVTCLYVGEHGSNFLRPDSKFAASISERLEKIHHEVEDISDFEVESGGIARTIHRVAVDKSANLIMTGRSRPGTISLGLQTHILIIDHNGPCPILSML